VKRAKTSDRWRVTFAVESFVKGEFAEALRELEKMTPASRTDTNVLNLRCHVFAGLERWEECLETGTAMVKLAPNAAHAWSHRSLALHRLGRTREALELMERAEELFPGEWYIHYDMACYSCQLGKREAAWYHFENAFDLGGPERVRPMALEDEDLEPLWAKIRMK
jgi:tetratricopeptide (TPR) repeat protein